MLMKSRPYPIPYPADSGTDSGPAVGHQQQAVREDIPRIGFPKGVEQEAAQYGNEANVDVEPICAMPIRAMPVRTELIRTELIRIKLIRHVAPQCTLRYAQPFGQPCVRQTLNSRRFLRLSIQNTNTPRYRIFCHALHHSIYPPHERTFIDFLKKCTPSSIGSQGSLSTGIGAVRPLG